MPLKKKTKKRVWSITKAGRKGSDRTKKKEIKKRE